MFLCTILLKYMQVISNNTVKSKSSQYREIMENITNNILCTIIILSYNSKTEKKWNIKIMFIGEGRHIINTVPHGGLVVNGTLYRCNYSIMC